jgi:sRNA-binding carbon storage regulator CsrA
LLVLKHGTRQEVWIDLPAGLPAGSRVVVSVEEIRGQFVRLGFVAAKEIGINRREVVEASARRDRKDGE